MREDSQKLDGPEARISSHDPRANFEHETARKGGKTSFLERILTDNIRCIEGGPADTRLSDAQTLLGAARQRISDFIEGKPRTALALSFSGDDGTDYLLVKMDAESMRKARSASDGVAVGKGLTAEEAEQLRAAHKALAPQFAVGDVVVLNGHERKMTVTCDAIDAPYEVVCSWFDAEGRWCDALIPEAALREWPRRP